jgi:uncharacterized protein (DUF305 family)
MEPTRRRRNSHRGGLALVAAAALVAGALVISHDGDVSAAEPAHTSAGSRALHKAMEDGHQAMMQMKMTGDPDHDFAMMMSQHHQSGIHMSEAVLKHGKDPKIQDMARRIIEAQKKEIAEFDAWMKQHRAAAHH